MKRLYPIDQALAKRLVTRRHGLQWSQNKLALQSGLTEAAVAKYETCRTPIPPDKRAAIEHALTQAEQTREAVPA